jgi:two-component system cell cycle response regulator CtrA
VEVAGTKVSLTGKEYEMLDALALRLGSPLTKEMFPSQLYGGTDEPDLDLRGFVSLVRIDDPCAERSDNGYKFCRLGLRETGEQE